MLLVVGQVMMVSSTTMGRLLPNAKSNTTQQRHKLHAVGLQRQSKTDSTCLFARRDRQTPPRIRQRCLRGIKRISLFADPSNASSDEPSKEMLQ